MVVIFKTSLVIAETFSIKNLELVHFIRFFI